MANEWYEKHAKDVTTALARAKKAPQKDAVSCTLVKMKDSAHLLCANVAAPKAAALVKEAKGHGGKVVSAGSLYFSDNGVVTFAVTEGSLEVKSHFSAAAATATGKGLNVFILGVGDLAAPPPAAAAPPPDFGQRAGRLVAAVKEAPKELQQPLQSALAQALKLGKAGDYARGFQLLDGLDRALQVHEKAHEKALADQKENKKLLDELPKVDGESTPETGTTAPALGEQAGEILRRLDTVYKPPAVVPPELADAAPAERKPIDDARQEVLDLLNQPLSADLLKQAKGVAVFKVERLITQAAEAVRDRLVKEAQAIRDDPAMKQTVDDANEDDLKDLKAAREKVLAALPDAPKGADVKNATELLKAVKTALTDAKARVQTRLKNEAEPVLAVIADDKPLGQDPDPAGLASGDATAVARQQRLTDLQGALTNGGLGERPEVFAHLASRNGMNPADLQTFCAEFRDPAEQARLRDLTRNGLGGASDESPERLAQVFTKGFTGTAAERATKLKDLHAAFNGGPPAGADLPKLKTTFDSFDAPPPPPPPSLAGERMGRVMGHVGRVPPPSPNIARLKTQYYDKTTQNSRSAAARATQEKIARNPTARATADQAAKVEQTAGATAPVTGAAKAAAKATAACALAGLAPTTDVVRAAVASATAAQRIAELGANPNAAAEAQAALEQTVWSEQPPPTAEEVKTRVAALAKTANTAAQQAALAAQQAVQVLQAAVPPNPLPTPTQIKAAADAAQAAADAAAKAIDPTDIQACLQQATATARAAAVGAAQAAGAEAKAKANTAAQQAFNAATGIQGGNPTSATAANLAALERAYDAAQEAALSAAVAANPAALGAALDAAQDEEALRTLAADPTATPSQIEAARAQAKQSAETAADKKATAATTAAQAAVTALQTGPVTVVKLALATTAADAAAAAAVDAPTQGHAARLAADQAYNEVLSRGSTGPKYAAATGTAVTQRRLLAGAANVRKRKTQSSLPVEDLLRNGASFEKLPTAPLPQPSLGGGNSADMAHICGRHSRERFTFGPHELTTKEEIQKAFLVEGMSDGVPLNVQEQNAMDNRPKAKITTFFPEKIQDPAAGQHVKIDAARIAKFVENAVNRIKASGAPYSGNVVRAPSFRLTSPRANWSGVPVGDGFTVTIGLRQAGPNHFVVGQMYPDGGPVETIDFFDMHGIKDTLRV